MFEVLTGRNTSKPMVHDPDTGALGYPLDRDPHPAMQEVNLENSKRKKRAKITVDLVKRLMCDCMSRGRQSKCADKKKFQLQNQLALFKKAAAQWDSGLPECDCGCARLLIAEFMSSPLRMMQSSMCKPVHIPEFDIDAYDSKTGVPNGDKQTFELRPLCCHESKCKDCGWGKVFGSCPELTPTDGGVGLEPIRSCKRHSTNAPFVWYSWQKVANTPPADSDEADPEYTPSAMKARCGRAQFTRVAALFIFLK